jgi:hypothetical protein
VGSKRKALSLTSAVSVLVALSLALGTTPAEASTRIHVHPDSGPPGTTVHIGARGFLPSGPCRLIFVRFTDAAGEESVLGTTYPDADGHFRLKAFIPSAAAQGEGTVSAFQRSYDPVRRRCFEPGRSASTGFVVTSGSREVRKS